MTIILETRIHSFGCSFQGRYRNLCLKMDNEVLESLGKNEGQRIWTNVASLTSRKINFRKILLNAVKLEKKIQSKEAIFDMFIELFKNISSREELSYILCYSSIWIVCTNVWILNTISYKLNFWLILYNFTMRVSMDPIISLEETCFLSTFLASTLVFACDYQLIFICPTTIASKL